MIKFLSPGWTEYETDHTNEQYQNYMFINPIKIAGKYLYLPWRDVTCPQLHAYKIKKGGNSIHKI